MDKFTYIEPGGMVTVEATEAKDHGVYLEVQSSSWDEDTTILAHLPPQKARELAAWLLGRYWIKPMQDDIDKALGHERSGDEQNG